HLGNYQPHAMIQPPPLPPAPTRFRRLRIFLSGLCFVACLGFVGLWVRSYRWSDRVQVPISKARDLDIFSINALLSFQCFTPPSDEPRWRQMTWVCSPTPLPEVFKDFPQRPPFSRFTFADVGYYSLNLPHWFFALIAGLSS